MFEPTIAVVDAAERTRDAFVRPLAAFVRDLATYAAQRDEESARAAIRSPYAGVPTVDASALCAVAGTRPLGDTIARGTLALPHESTLAARAFARGLAAIAKAYREQGATAREHVATVALAFDFDARLDDVEAATFRRIVALAERDDAARAPGVAWQAGTFAASLAHEARHAPPRPAPGLAHRPFPARAPEAARVVKRRKAHFSASSLGTYAACERHWYYRYVCAAVEDRGSSASFYGSAFHWALERFHEEFPRADAVPPEVLERKLEGALNVAFERFRSGFATTVEYELQRRRALRTGRRYLAWFLERARAHPFAVVGIETKVELDLDGYAFVGYIDRLDRDDATGAVTIVDYKTGSIAESADRYREGVATFVDFQLPFYYWARTAAGDRVTRLSLVPLKDASREVAPIELEIVPVAAPRSYADGTTGTIGMSELERARTRMIELAAALADGPLAQFPVTEDAGVVHVLCVSYGVPGAAARARRPIRAVNVVAPGDARERALAHPTGGGSLALVGRPGTGKTTALVERAWRLARESHADVALFAPSDAGVARLRARLAERQNDGFDRGRIVCETFGDAALATLRAGDGAADVELIDDVRASLHFERAGAALFALEWTEFVSAEVDYEITGLRTPERFSAAAFRLIRKLRASLVSPDAFKTYGLRGATEFYGRPPNFADAHLIAMTDDKYRDSLRVTPAELDRQRAREIDLVKILARLYASYLETLVARGCLTPTDAVYEAALALRDDGPRRRAARRAYAAVLVDDAQDLTLGQLAYLEGIASDGLANVTLAGDHMQSTRGFATGARGAEVFKRAATVIECTTSYRNAPAIARAADTLFDARAGARTATEAGTVRGYRGDSVRDEARYVATEVARLVAAGTPPGRIAIVSRGLRGAADYVAALLARDVPVDVAGAASPYDARAASDALAALWSVADPFRHDQLLRALAAPWVGLSDASIATLCAEATQSQPLLFESEDDVDPARSTRWDKKRDVRLGRNVTRGDVDADLPADARERLRDFRDALARYDDARRTHDLPTLARLVLGETVLATIAGDARGTYDRHAVARVLDDVDAFAARDPFATLHDYLTHVEIVAAAEDDLLAIAPRDLAAVRVLDVEAAKGETFEAVFAVNVRAGAWPRYYVPDAFLFTTALGMLPKENVGDARAARTAKFTYAMAKLQFREKYNTEERRALYVAMTRATSYLSISTNGRATRGKSAPELFEELRGAMQR